MGTVGVGPTRSASRRHCPSPHDLGPCWRLSLIRSGGFRDFALFIDEMSTGHFAVLAVFVDRAAGRSLTVRREGVVGQGGAKQVRQCR